MLHGQISKYPYPPLYGKSWPVFVDSDNGERTTDNASASTHVLGPSPSIDNRYHNGLCFSRFELIVV